MSAGPLNNRESNAAIPAQPPKSTVADRLRSEMPSMKTAVMWSEILDKPLSKRGRR